MFTLALVAIATIPTLMPAEADAQWAVQSSPVSVDLRAIAATSTTIAHATCIAGSSRIHRTTERWSEIAPERIPPAIAGQGGFATSGSCLAVLGSSHVRFDPGGAATARAYRSAVAFVPRAGTTTASTRAGDR